MELNVMLREKFLAAINNNVASSQRYSHKNAEAAGEIPIATKPCKQLKVFPIIFINTFMEQYSVVYIQAAARLKRKKKTPNQSTERRSARVYF